MDSTVWTNNICFCSGEIKKLLLELDPYGGAEPDGIFPLFFINAANHLPPKTSTVSAN